MDVIANENIDYELYDVNTGWNAGGLEQSLIESQADLLIIPTCHWLDNYDDFDILSDVLNSYVSNGGGVLFSANQPFYGDLFDGNWGSYFENVTLSEEYYNSVRNQLWRELRDQLTLVFYTQRI